MSNSKFNTTGTGTGQDREFESLRDAWKELRQDEPPELVDQAVLSRARRDLEKPRARRLRWLGGFATAAVAVVAISLVVHQEPWAPSPEMIDGIPRQSTPAAARKSEVRRDEPGQSVLEEEPAKELRQSRAFAEDALPMAAAPPAAASESAERAAPDLAGDREDDATNMMKATEALTEAFSDEDKSGPSSKDDLRQADAWIERLMELQQQGETERLAQELEAFRAAYPDYPLPPELTGN